MGSIDLRAEIRQVLSTRRAPHAPEAGLPAYGGNRRVKGPRREEVAMLAGVSIGYDIRMERGSLAGARRACSTPWLMPCGSTRRSGRTSMRLARAGAGRGPGRKRTSSARVRPAFCAASQEDLPTEPATAGHGR